MLTLVLMFSFIIIEKEENIILEFSQNFANALYKYWKIKR